MNGPCEDQTHNLGVIITMLQATELISQGSKGFGASAVCNQDSVGVGSVSPILSHPLHSKSCSPCKSLCPVLQVLIKSVVIKPKGTKVTDNIHQKKENLKAKRWMQL